MDGLKDMREKSCWLGVRCDEADRAQVFFQAAQQCRFLPRGTKPHPRTIQSWPPALFGWALTTDASYLQATGEKHLTLTVCFANANLLALEQSFKVSLGMHGPYLSLAPAAN